MEGLAIELVGMTHLDQLTRVHHRGVVRKLTAGGNVVGDKNEAGLCFAFDCLQNIQPNASAVAIHVSRQETQDGTRQRTLAAATLPNNYHRPPSRQGQADPVYCLHRTLACAEVQPQVINGEKAVSGHHTSRSLGLTTRSRAKPNMVNPSPLTISSTAGSSTQ